jgi:cell division protein FtsN
MWWRWLLVAGLIGAFVMFLNMIRNMVPELLAGKPQAEQSQQAPEATLKQELAIKQPESSVKSTDPEKTTTAQSEPTPPAEPEEPRYDFYTILPQAETVIPDYEIKSRVREELVGKTKVAKYVMQAGSFREASEAERHKAKLALLGIESRVEKAKVGNVIWHRVKIGPYDNPSSVATIKELLQKNGIGVIVTESSQQ